MPRVDLSAAENGKGSSRTLLPQADHWLPAFLLPLPLGIKLRRFSWFP
jgi:hypothetical protein